MGLFIEEVIFDDVVFFCLIVEVGFLSRNVRSGKVVYWISCLFRIKIRKIFLLLVYKEFKL